MIDVVRPFENNHKSLKSLLQQQYNYGRIYKYNAE